MAAVWLKMTVAEADLFVRSRRFGVALEAEAGALLGAQAPRATPFAAARAPGSSSQ
jgi:hypothetical protein